MKGQIMTQIQRFLLKIHPNKFLLMQNKFENFKLNIRDDDAKFIIDEHFCYKSIFRIIIINNRKRNGLKLKLE